MALAALFPVAARVALLGKSAVPIPGSADGLSFVLLADTLRHFRLANPTHTMHRFFEALFVLQEPAYASIYPAGQGSRWPWDARSSATLGPACSFR